MNRKFHLCCVFCCLETRICICSQELIQCLLATFNSDLIHTLFSISFYFTVFCAVFNVHPLKKLLRFINNLILTGSEHLYLTLGKIGVNTNQDTS